MRIDEATARGTVGRPRRMSTLFRLGAFVVMVAGCASSGASNTTMPARYEGTAVAPRGRRLEVLPESSTYAWVLPSELFERTLPADDVSAGNGDSRTARNAIETILLGNGWTAAPRGTAEFEVALFVQRRPRTRADETHIQRTAPQEFCEPASRPPTNPCPPPRPLPTRQPVEVYLDEQLVLGMRRADGAGFYRYEPFMDGARTGNVVAQDLLKRILASRPSAQSVTVPDVGRPSGELLKSLPSNATYAWVAPAVIYSRVLPSDDRSTVDPDVIAMRDAIDVVLTGSAWRQAPHVASEFEVTLFVQDRERERLVSAQTGKELKEAPTGQGCDPTTRDFRLPPCTREQRDRERQSKKAVKTGRVTVRTAVLGVRRADGAGIYFDVPYTNPRATADSLSGLLVRRLLTTPR